MGQATLPSPYRRPDGRWTAQLSLGTGSDGKRTRRTVYGRTARECRERLIAALDAHRTDPTLAPLDARTTIAVLTDRWLAAAAVDLRPHTLRFYRDQVRLHIIPALGGVPVSKLTRDQVQRFVNDRTAAGFAPRMVRHIRATLRAALNYAMDEGMIRQNPAAMRIRLPALDERGVSAMTPDEARHLLDVSAQQEHRLHALWMMAVYLGLRQGELLALRWDNLQGDRLTVDRSLQRVDGRLQLVPTKTRGSVRTLILPVSVAVALRAHRRAQEAESRRPGYVDHRLIFATSIGTPIEARNLIRDWHRLTRRAGLRRYRFHDLRHTCATLLLSAGVAPLAVAEQLGHRDATMLLKVYGHVLPSQRDEAATRMEALLG